MIEQRRIGLGGLLVQNRCGFLGLDPVQDLDRIGGMALTECGGQTCCIGGARDEFLDCQLSVRHHIALSPTRLHRLLMGYAANPVRSSGEYPLSGDSNCGQSGRAHRGGKPADFNDELLADGALEIAVAVGGDHE